MTSSGKPGENGTKFPDFSTLINPVTVRHMVREWLKEDTPTFDYGGFVVGEKEEEAVLLQKTPGVLAGTPFVDAVFTELDCKVKWLVPEGTYIETVRTVAKVRGKVRRLLLGERVALNCVSRCSGIASIARRLAQLAKDAEWGGEVAGTRKTTPGFRLVEKYGLLVGGVSTHRFDMSSMIMLKDNHIWVAGNITQAVKDARVVGGFSTKIEVECRSLDEASEAAHAGAEVIMLDNFEPEAAKEMAKVLRERFPSLIIESSGGITEESIKQYFDGNIDVISLSKLTQGYETLDFSLKVLKDGRDPRNLLVTSGGDS